MKKTFKLRLLSLSLCLLMLFTPALFAGCESETAAAEPATWYRGKANIETVTDGKAGDFYVDTDDYKLYQKGTDGKWNLIMEDFGKPGEAAEPKKSYVHVRYAKDSSGTDISTDPTGRGYVSILTTEKENPEASDFTVWIKFVGEDGAVGEAGTGSYIYIAFAEDNLGNGFSKIYTPGQKYIAILTTNTEIINTTKNDFVGKWIKFVGQDGVNGENGLTPYIGYDGYWWTGTEKGQHKFVEILTESTVENTLGLAGNKYFEGYALDMGQSSVALMSHYFEGIEKTVYSGVPVKKIELYAETAGTLTVSTVKTKGLASRAAGSAQTLNVIKQFTLTAGLNVLDLSGAFVPEGETLVLGKTGDTAKLVAYKGINQDDEQGYFTVLSDTGVYKQTGGVKDRLVIKAELSAEAVEAIEGFGDVIASTPPAGSSDWKSAHITSSYRHGVLDAFSGKKISRIDVRAGSHTATSPDNVFMTVKVLKKDSAVLVGTYKFYANPADITDTSLNKVITLTCNEEISVGEDETLAFANSDDTLVWSYVTGLSSTPLTGGFVSVSIGKSIGTLAGTALTNMLAINVYINPPSANEVLAQLEFEEKLEMELIPGLKELLSGKKVSVVGDSISTYLGVSNNGDANSVTATNKVFYGDGTDPNHGTSLNSNVKLNETWWMRTINNYDMVLNVNNSYSGSWVTDKRGGNVAACNTRAENLHKNDGTKPDIIATFIGTNDLGSGNRPCNQTFDNAFFTRVESGSYTSPITTNDSVTLPSYFDEGYTLMISKMKKAYPDADIFCFTIPKRSNVDNDLLVKYNNAIKAIAAHYGCSVVDLYSSEFSENYSQYTLDNLHPNPTGMDIISKEFAKALAKKYLAQ